VNELFHTTDLNFPKLMLKKKFSFYGSQHCDNCIVSIHSFSTRLITSMRHKLWRIKRVEKLWIDLYIKTSLSGMVDTS